MKVIPRPRHPVPKLPSGGAFSSMHTGRVSSNEPLFLTPALTLPRLRAILARDPEVRYANLYDNYTSVMSILTDNYQDTDLVGAAMLAMSPFSPGVPYHFMRLAVLNGRNLGQALVREMDISSEQGRLFVRDYIMVFAAALEDGVRTAKSLLVTGSFEPYLQYIFTCVLEHRFIFRNRIAAFEKYFISESRTTIPMVTTADDATAVLHKYTYRNLVVRPADSDGSLAYLTDRITAGNERTMTFAEYLIRTMIGTVAESESNYLIMRMLDYVEQAAAALTQEDIRNIITDDEVKYPMESFNTNVFSTSKPVPRKLLMFLVLARFLEKPQDVWKQIENVVYDILTVVSDRPEVVNENTRPVPKFGDFMIAAGLWRSERLWTPIAIMLMSYIESDGLSLSVPVDELTGWANDQGSLDPNINDDVLQEDPTYQAMLEIVEQVPTGTSREYFERNGPGFFYTKRYRDNVAALGLF